MYINGTVRLKKIIIDEKVCFSMLMFVLWTQHTIFTFVKQVFRQLPLIGRFYMYLVPTIIIILTIFSLTYIFKNIKPIDLVLCALFLSVIILYLIFIYPNNKYIEQYWSDILIVTIPMYFVGLSYSHEDMEEILYYASVIGLFTTFAYRIISLGTGAIMSVDNMDAAYKILPSVMYIAYTTLKKRNIINYLLSVFGIINLFIYGTRGPILVILVYVLLHVFFLIVTSKSLTVKIFFVVFSIAFITVFSSQELWLSISEQLLKLFENIGFSTRIFERLLDGTIAKSSGREMISSKVIDAIANKPMIGHGLMGSFLVSGIYSHNIILDYFCDFGVILGTILLCITVYVPFKSLYTNRNNEYFYYILMLSCLVFIKLLFSNYYLFEPYLLFLFGVCANNKRNLIFGGELQ